MRSLKIDPPKSLAQMATARLRQAIIDGELALGAAIGEEALAHSLGISRTPVREALNQLQLQGLVVVRPQVGSFVFSPSADDVAALCQFRIVLEPKAAEFAYKLDKVGTIAALTAAIAEMEVALAARDNVAYGRADTAFHEALFARCGNRYLQEAYQLAAGRIAALRTNMSAPIDVQSPVSFEEHGRLLALFEAGDFAAFETQMIAHVTKSAKAYEQAVLTGRTETT